MKCDLDLISRAKAIYEIHDFFSELMDKLPITVDEDGDEVITDAKTANTLLVYNKMLCKRFNALPSADRPRGEWISVSEKLPSEKKAVLICDSGGNRFVGELILTDHGYKWKIPLFTVWMDIEDGDAWMPLPEPYREEE